MKKLLLISIWLCLSNVLLAQLPNITAVEYFIDTDPGYGLATSVPVNITSSDLDLDFVVDISACAEGMHTLFIRGKDENDNWSITKSHTFFTGFGIRNQDISLIEYFFDTDPGYENGNLIWTEEYTFIESKVKLDVSFLENGIHTVFVRVKDKAGQWSTTKNHTFYKGIFSSGELSEIKTVEYYFDNDPGFGNAEKITFTPNTDLDLTFDLDLTALTEECHELFIRTQDNNESWSLIYRHPFCITPTGITEPDISDFNIFPNPSTGNFTIQFQNNNKNTCVEIYTETGQKVFIKNYSKGTITDRIVLHELKGLFLLKAKSGDEITVKKLTIE